jgi:hypothetical protein
MHVLAMRMMRGTFILSSEKYSDIYCPYFCSLSPDAKLVRFLYDAQDFGSKVFGQLLVALGVAVATPAYFDREYT